MNKKSAPQKHIRSAPIMKKKLCMIDRHVFPLSKQPAEIEPIRSLRETTQIAQPLPELFGTTLHKTANHLWLMTRSRLHVGKDRDVNTDCL